MPDSESVAAYRSSPRGFARALMLGGLIAAAALASRTVTYGPHHKAAFAPRPTLLQIIDAAPVEPSAYDREAAMSPAQLLNRWNGFIAEASRRFHVPPEWIRAVMQRESGGRTMLGEGRPIVSRAGAVGLMQVLPGTYDEMATQHRLGSNPFDAHDNIMAGAAYLRWLHKKYGYPAMFAAYNAGPGKLEDHLQHGVRLPAETRAYIAGITRGLKLSKRDFPTVRLTRPDGAPIRIDPAQVTAIRAPLPGEYAPDVKAVVTLGKAHQAIREDIAVATSEIRGGGGLI